MSDAAAFSATLVDFKIIRTRKCVQFVFEEDAVRVPPDIVSEILADLAALVDGKIKFALARLVPTGELGEARFSRPTTADGSTLQRVEGTAPGDVTAPARKLSRDVYLHYLNQPRFRVFLEQRRRHAIPENNHINNVDEAKHVLRSWLGIESLSELDSDTAAADRWERVEADYKTWISAAIYVEAP